MISHAQARAIVDAEREEAGVRYAWVVTHEYEMDDDWDGNLKRLKGRWKALPEDEWIEGPSGATEEQLQLARKGMEWRCDYDGDGPALKGRMWASDSPDDASQSMACWAPREDYAEPGVGAIHLFYKVKGKWVEL